MVKIKMIKKLTIHKKIIVHKFEILNKKLKLKIKTFHFKISLMRENVK